MFCCYHQVLSLPGLPALLRQHFNSLASFQVTFQNGCYSNLFRTLRDDLLAYSIRLWLIVACVGAPGLVQVLVSLRNPGASEQPSLV